jgi:hypothetical protein
MASTNKESYENQTKNQIEKEPLNAKVNKVELFETENQAPVLNKRGCYKNLIMLSLAFFFLFCGFNSLANLQSSLNSEAGLGTVSLCVVYASFCVSCLFLPPIMIAKIGYKWSIVICMCTYCIYIITNLYVKWWTLIPGF